MSRCGLGLTERVIEEWEEEHEGRVLDGGVGGGMWDMAGKKASYK